eukprot:13007714-Alexandrium_andersonii.AAC.1
MSNLAGRCTPRGGELMPLPPGTEHSPVLQDAGQGDRVDPRRHLLPREFLLILWAGATRLGPPL